jgi:uncharacterized protein YraI
MQLIGGCDQAVSNNAVAVITADLVVSTQPTDVNECVGGTNTMSVTVTGGSGQSLTNGNKVQMEVQDGQTQQEQVQPLQPTHHQVQYRVRLITEYWLMQQTVDATRAVSNNAVAIITADLVVSTQPTNVNECVGGTNTMTVTVTGGSGAITYQWQQSADGSTVGLIQPEQEQQQLLTHHQVQLQYNIL